MKFSSVFSFYFIAAAAAGPLTFTHSLWARWAQNKYSTRFTCDCDDVCINFSINSELSISWFFFSLTFPSPTSLSLSLNHNKHSYTHNPELNVFKFSFLSDETLEFFILESFLMIPFLSLSRVLIFLLFFSHHEFFTQLIFTRNSTSDFTANLPKKYYPFAPLFICTKNSRLFNARDWHRREHRERQLHREWKRLVGTVSSAMKRRGEKKVVQ